MAEFCYAVGLLYVSFLTAQRRASRFKGRRRFTLITNLVLLGFALAIALWLPTFVPDTPGSPAALVMLLSCWLIGGSMALMALVSFLGAWFSKAR